MVKRKRRKGTREQVKAKEDLKRIFAQNPEIISGRMNAYEVIGWVKENYPEIAKTLGYDRIIGVYGLFRNPKYRDDLIKSFKSEEEEPPSQPEETETEDSNTSNNPNPPTPTPIPIPTPTLPLYPPTIDQSYNREGDLVPPPYLGTQPMTLGPNEAVVEVEGVPVGRKIRLTPKNLALFDWFKARYGYDGDLSDFINDAIDDFFRSRGYSLKVVREEEVK